MGLFDGVGGPMGGTMPLGTMTPMSVATSLGAAASAVGMAGFSMAPAPFQFMAGVGWGVRSSYFGHPEFRGVADMAIASNDIQRGWPPMFSLGVGLGTFLGAPPIGSGGYYIGPGPQFFDPMAMFAWMYQQTFGPAQQPAGPAQAAAPQPAQVNAKGEEPKADEAGKGGKTPRPYKGGGKSKKPAAAAGPAASGPAAAPASAKPSGAATSAAGASPASGAEKPMTEEEARRTVEIMGKAIRTDEEKVFLDRMKREHPSVFKK